MLTLIDNYFNKNIDNNVSGGIHKSIDYHIDKSTNIHIIVSGVIHKNIDNHIDKSIYEYIDKYPDNHIDIDLCQSQ